ncbi:Fc.00g113590.m01.CDS01 [Cosmosporella sp. VM-42]
MFGNVTPDERHSPAVPLPQQGFKPSTNQYLGAGQISTKKDGPESKLVIKQSPILGRALGKEKDRKPLDPPPIVQLLDRRPNIYDSPYLFMICSLLAKDYDFLTSSVEHPPNYLAGSRASSIYHLKDTTGTHGGFFIFGDVSVRHEGIFRLRFTLYNRIENTGSPSFYFVSEVISDPVTIYSPKKFPGMAESTLLTRVFCEQGVKLRLRKDGRAISTKKRTQESADDIAGLQAQAFKRMAYDRGSSFGAFGQGLGSTTPEDIHAGGSGGMRAASVPSTSRNPPPISNSGTLLTSTVFDPGNYTHAFNQAPIAPVHGDLALNTPYTMSFATSSDYSGVFEASPLLYQNDQMPELSRDLSQSFLGREHGISLSPVQGLPSTLTLRYNQTDQLVESGNTQEATFTPNLEPRRRTYQPPFSIEDSQSNTRNDIPQ